MKIAILIPNFSKFDGGARAAELQAEELAEEGNHVAIFALTADIKPKNAALFIMGTPKSLLWRRIYLLLFPLDLFKTFRWLPRLKKFDMVIVHLYPLTWLAFLAKKIYKVKYTFWYHGIADPQFFPHLYERIYMRLQIFLTKLAVRNVDRAVAVSKFAQAELKKYTGLDSEVIYNEVVPERFHPGIDGTKIRQRHNLGDAPVILSVGRVCPQKGFHLLIQAFNIVKETIPNAKLVIVGKHDYDYYSKQLRELSNDSVIFSNYIPDEDMPYYYAMCELYATCSLWETYNRPLVEAQACGKPVVAFNMGPHSEVINEQGILVETGNVEKFAQACVEKLRQMRGIQ